MPVFSEIFTQIMGISNAWSNATSLELITFILHSPYFRLGHVPSVLDDISSMCFQELVVWNNCGPYEELECCPDWERISRSFEERKFKGTTTTFWNVMRNTEVLYCLVEQGRAKAEASGVVHLDNCVTYNASELRVFYGNFGFDEDEGSGRPESNVNDESVVSKDKKEKSPVDEWSIGEGKEAFMVVSTAPRVGGHGHMDSASSKGRYDTSICSEVRGESWSSSTKVDVGLRMC
ncbi:hypothetical protein EV421DRAFT_1733835 [Armillaria borealis]|uniref:Uncharacterized protein n=1 Tax=Armillaria borealis TaxID=47425 RepID=A0AA39MUP0_9AGAR|nr:hypothetical protein EV421DRAFT_1733835 [Armillaria borealis]